MNSDIGSPPHTWRILLLIALINDTRRITSTHVENTLVVVIKLALFRDHLHTRGEYNNIDLLAL